MRDFKYYVLKTIQLASIIGVMGMVAYFVYMLYNLTSMNGHVC